MPSTILFISHEASRTGAPIILLHLLRWLKFNTNIPFIIICKKDGELLEEFKKLAPTYTYDFNYKPLVGLKGKLTGNWDTYISIPLHYINLKKIIKSHQVTLVYSNTILNGDILEFLSFLNCKVITHVHELEIGIYFKGSKNLQLVQKYTSHYIAASLAVKQNLIMNHYVDEKSISVVYECIDINKEDKQQKGVLRNSFQLPSDTFIVGASGTIDLRKGFDLFIQLAIEIHKTTSRNITFVWVGGEKNSDLLYMLKRDLAKLKLEEKVLFIPNQSNPMSYFVDFDVFVMMSREDPYPLVCLESAYLKKPILCFENSGGMPEFVENNCGFVVPYLDIKAMAIRIRELQANPVLRLQLGENARKKAALHHDVNVTAPKILEVIHRFSKVI